MIVPDFDGACAYALARLSRDLLPELTYHSLSHTRVDVVPAAERFAAGEGVTGRPLLLLLTAAYFHYIGFVERREAHEAAGAAIAARVLPRFGYTPQQITQIQGMIMATRLPQTPHNHLGSLLADADMDVLGRDDFFERNVALRAEVETLGSTVTTRAWLSQQLRFLAGHRYFTEAARTLRGRQKEENVQRLSRLLAQCGSSASPDVTE